MFYFLRIGSCIWFENIYLGKKVINFLKFFTIFRPPWYGKVRVTARVKESEEILYFLFFSKKLIKSLSKMNVSITEYCSKV